MKKLANEIKKIAKSILAGGIQALEPDTMDVLENVVYKNKNKSVKEIAKIINNDKFLAQELKNINVNNIELENFIKETIMLY